MSPVRIQILFLTTDDQILDPHGYTYLGALFFDFGAQTHRNILYALGIQAIKIILFMIKQSSLVQFVYRMGSLLRCRIFKTFWQPSCF
jgi:hypothetical protein